MKSPPAPDCDAAFRAGLFGLPPALADSGQVPATPPAGAGPNEAVVLATGRLPGLTEPRAAYQTGRALRFIAQLFDRAGAPASVGRQFRDNLAAAVITHHMRRSGAPWSVTDTVDMFMEIYARVLGRGGRDYEAVRRAILEHARSLPAVSSTPALRPAAGQRRFRTVLQGGRAAGF